MSMTPTVFRLSSAWPRCSTSSYAKMPRATACCRCICRCSSYLAQANRYSDLSRSPSPSYLGITRGTVSQTLAVLERKGLISRRHPTINHGQAASTCTLTAAGESVLAASWPQRLDEALLAAGGATSEAFANHLRRVLCMVLQRLNGRIRHSGSATQCAHFLGDDAGSHRCGLTGETLAAEQTVRICREWTSPLCGQRRSHEPRRHPAARHEPAWRCGSPTGARWRVPVPRRHRSRWRSSHAAVAAAAQRQRAGRRDGVDAEAYSVRMPARRSPRGRVSSGTP
jgi:MarR family transcriptional repressor of emrRAB